MFNSLSLSTLQEEWKEIQEEKKDYSNLKIGQLSLNDNNNYVADSDAEGEDGEDGNERNSAVDPWKKGDSSSSAEPVQQNQESARPAAASSGSKLYISPALRAAANAVSYFFSPSYILVSLFFVLTWHSNRFFFSFVKFGSFHVNSWLSSRSMTLRLVDNGGGFFIGESSWFMW